VARTETKTLAGMTAVFTPPAEGKYTAVATTRNPEEVGPFTLSVEPLAPTFEKAESLAVSDPYDAAPTGRNAKTYEQPLEAKRLYRIEMSSPQFDAQLRLLDERGNPLAYDRDERKDFTAKRRAVLSYEPQAAVKARLVATSSQPGQNGPFSLRIQTLAVRSTKEGTIAASDPFDRMPTQTYRKTYRMRLEQGKEYLVEMASKTMDSVLRVEDGQGRVLGRSDLPGTSTERVLLIPEKTDEYVIVATTYPPRQTGAFTLAVTTPKAVSSQAGALSKDDFYDPLMNSCFQKVHAFDLKAGKTYLVRLESKAFAPYLRLETGRGQHLKRVHDQGRTGAAYVLYVPAKDEKYRVIVTSGVGGQTGAYTLTVSTM
jgi:hypothetical protein